MYSKTRFSTNINLALANTKGVILAVRLALLVLHLIIVQVMIIMMMIMIMMIIMTMMMMMMMIMMQTPGCVSPGHTLVHRYLLSFYILLHTWLYLVLSLGYYLFRRVAIINIQKPISILHSSLHPPGR